LLRKLIVFLLLFNLSFLFYTKDDLTKKVKVKISSIKPFKVFFNLKVIDEGDIVSEENGYIIYSDEEHLKWVYLKPSLKIWVLKNNRYEFYEKDEAQLTRGFLKDKKRIWLWRIFHTNYDNSVKSDKKKRIIFFNESESGINFKIELKKNFLPNKVIQTDPTGVLIEYKFGKYLFKIDLKKDEFEIKYEKGTDIVETE